MFDRDSTSNRQPDPRSEGDHQQFLVVDGRTRSYVVHIPPGYTGTSAIPLVIVIHGGAGNAQYAMKMSGMSKKADEEGFIVVYPNGTGILKRRWLTWNAGNCCGYALDHQVDDVKFFKVLIESVQSEFNIDPARIFATGMSNGGMMVYRLACELSDQIAAISPVAGAMNIESCNPTSPVSVIIFHGTDDEHVLYEGGHPLKRIDNHDRLDTSVEDSVNFWAQQNECRTNPVIHEEGNIIQENYTDCMPGTAVILYAIKGGGHSWPGGERLPSTDEPTQEISATDLMWDFFQQHPKIKP